MRLVQVPDVGPRRALQPVDLIRLQPFFTALEQELQLHVAALQFPGACTGHFELCPSINVYTVPARAGTRIQPLVIMVPGICYGSDMWMPKVLELIDRLGDQGIDAFYDHSTISDVDLSTLQVKAAAELVMLRGKLAARLAKKA